MSDIDPFKDFVPRQNPPSVQAAQTVQSPSFLPDLSDDDLRKLAREKLSEALQAIDPKAQPEITRKLCAEVKDRLDGRAPQAITTTNVNLNATVDETFGIPLDMRMDMLRHKLAQYDDEQAKTIEHQPT